MCIRSQNTKRAAIKHPFCSLCRCSRILSCYSLEEKIKACSRNDDLIHYVSNFIGMISKGEISVHKKACSYAGESDEIRTLPTSSRTRYNALVSAILHSHKVRKFLTNGELRERTARSVSVPCAFTVYPDR